MGLARGSPRSGWCEGATFLTTGLVVRALTPFLILLWCRLLTLGLALSSSLQLGSSQVRSLDHAMAVEPITPEGGIPARRVAAVLFPGFLVAPVTLVGQHAADGGRSLGAPHHLGLELNPTVLFSQFNELVRPRHLVRVDTGVSGAGTAVGRTAVGSVMGRSRSGPSGPLPASSLTS